MAGLGSLPRDQIAAMLPGFSRLKRGGERDAAERSVSQVCSRIDNEDAARRAVDQSLEAIKPGDRDQLLSLVGRVGGKNPSILSARLPPTATRTAESWGSTRSANGPTPARLTSCLRLPATPPTRPNSQAFQGYVKIAATRDKRNDRERLNRMKQAMQAAKSNDEQLLVVNRCRTAYDVETLRFVLPYVAEAPLAETACETIVEFAHHREIRDPNKAEFDKALDGVIAVSKNPEVIERANRYKRGETWERKTKAGN